MTSRTLRRGDAEWPSQLDELGAARPAQALYVDGREIPRHPLMAVVGSRRPTIAGLDATKTLVTGLVEAGFGIVSGMAAGIDAAAHEAALGAGGYTLAVLGFGLDVDYPRRNADLKRRIREQGTLVTEYEAGVQPYKSHFPERNRIIAGLALGTLVVEGGIQSGALITARIALDANRSVFAVPGSFRNVMSAGSNELIRSSQAGLVTEVRHIFEELAPELVRVDAWELGVEKRRVELDDNEASVLSLLDDVTVSPDRICRELRCDTGRVALALARLEMRGLALRRGVGYQITAAGRAPAPQRRALKLRGRPLIS